MEKEMNAKTLDDLVKDIVREYPGFVVPDRGYWPINVPMIEYSREKDEYFSDCDNRNCKGEVFGTPDERFKTSNSTFGHTTLGDLKSIIDEAIEKYGCIKGIFLGGKRILKCNPFSKGGYDPLK